MVEYGHRDDCPASRCNDQFHVDASPCYPRYVSPNATAKRNSVNTKPANLASHSSFPRALHPENKTKDRLKQAISKIILITMLIVSCPAYREGNAHPPWRGPTSYLILIFVRVLCLCDLV